MRSEPGGSTKPSFKEIGTPMARVRALLREGGSKSLLLPLPFKAVGTLTKINEQKDMVERRGVTKYCRQHEGIHMEGRGSSQQEEVSSTRSEQGGAHVCDKRISIAYCPDAT